MANKDNRFIKTYTQGSIECVEIWVDKETGVNYMFHCSGTAAGMTVLLDRDGRPVVTTVTEE